jgi:phosphoenolpyruvate synthase/pyruvate phosphate dikinase
MTRKGPAGLARRRDRQDRLHRRRGRALAAKGEKVILVRVETSPEDIHGMHAARGIVTARGGMTSHAAVVARGMGRPCVSGAGELRSTMRAANSRCAADLQGRRHHHHRRRHGRGDGRRGRR